MYLEYEQDDMQSVYPEPVWLDWRSVLLLLYTVPYGMFIGFCSLPEPETN